ncbi:hypothetical protein SK803_04200 [Lentzea sp. BCCO 10_0856]|uniref:Uncharacterized protein n=1 Tax=Lentzea miocenica TaxID=3095431 RepID=A0ABU4SU05_9PSEU|nr:hypothetical protein [Lentzea sp. BCCO 10_0856]MDX8029396.1 hypothetical protein [Lentzea sp. BCCO 10_0856]
MSKRVVDYDVYYVPWSLGDREAMARYAAEWLAEQQGAPLLLFPDKPSSEGDRLLNRLTAGAAAATPRNLGSSGWSKGPVLAAWPTDDVFELLTHGLRSRITALCVMEWGDSDEVQRTWLAGHQARSVVDGAVHPSSTVTLDPVVEVAMQYLEMSVNHGNSLTGPMDRRDAVETLRALHKAGYRYNVEELCIWALGNGFNFREVERLKEIAIGVQQGKRFRLQAGGFQPNIVKIWQAEAEEKKK